MRDSRPPGTREAMHRGRAVVLTGVLLSLVGPARAQVEVAPAAFRDPYRSRFQRVARELQEARARPRAIAELFEVLAFGENVAEPERLRVLESVADHPATHPLVAAHAAFELALLDERRGALAAANLRRQRLGLLSAFWLLGPFEAEGKSSIGARLPPEERWVAPAATEQVEFAGKLPGQRVGWRRAEGGAREGAFVVDAFVRPDVDATVFLATYLHSDRARTVALRLGSSGSLVVWCNGTRVFERAVSRTAYLDQDATTLRLKRGENLLVLKTSVAQRAWRVLARLTELDGRPLSGVRASLDGRRTVRLGAQVAAASVNPVTLEAQLRAAVAKARAGSTRGPSAAQHRARAWLDLARYLALVRSEDEAEDVVVPGLQSVADDETVGVELRKQALRWVAREARDDNRARAALLRALALEAQGPVSADADSEQCLILTELGRLARGDGRDEETRFHLDSALAAFPGCWPATLLLAEMDRAAGLVFAARERVLALAASVVRAGVDLPLPIESAWLAALEAARARGQADEEVTRMLKRHPGEVWLLGQALAAARARGERAKALELATRIAAARPDWTHAVVGLSALFEGGGDIEKARATLGQALTRLPDDPILHRAVGDLEARAGNLEAAAAALERSLAFYPQSPDVRRRLMRLRAEAHGRAVDRESGELAHKVAVDARKLAEAALNDKHDPVPVRVLAERRAVRVHSNGLSESYVQRIVQVRTQAAARAQHELAIRYLPGDQEVDIIEARIFRRSGTGALEIVSATGRDDRELSEPWYGLYYDARAQVIVFDDLRPGDVFEVQYTLSDVAPRNEMRDYFADLRFLADTAPVESWAYVLLVPAERPLYFHLPDAVGATYERRVREDGLVEHRVFAHNIARIEPEPMMPGWTEVAPYLHVSTYRTWDEVGRWYWQLIGEQMTPDDELRRVAARLGSGIAPDDRLEKVRRVHAFVIESTRYVGLEFGIHGYKPYPVSRILARRFGDCKDKASLIVALLGELGVRAELVLVRTRQGGRIGVQPASLAVFDHAIVYVPDLNLYLDGTAEFSGLRELPYAVQGATALHVGPDGARLVETPVLPSHNNRAERHWDVTLASDGSARIEESVVIVGQAAPDWRRHYQTEGERTERFVKMWSERLPGARVRQVEMPGIEDRNQPVRTVATVDVPALATQRAGEWHLPVAARTAEYLKSYARSAERDLDLVLAFPWQHEERIVYRLPAGFDAVRWPAGRHLRAPFGEFVFSVESDASRRVITVSSRLDVVQHRFRPAEYPELRAFFTQVEQTLSDAIVLRGESLAVSFVTPLPSERGYAP